MGEGDSTVSVFDSAPSALEAALAATRALSAEQWPTGLRIAARFGIHTGEAERRDPTTTAPASASPRGPRSGRRRPDPPFLRHRELVAGASARRVRARRSRSAPLARARRTPERIHALRARASSRRFRRPTARTAAFCAFEPDDRDFFFGRERLVEELIGRLAPGRLLAVVAHPEAASPRCCGPASSRPCARAKSPVSDGASLLTPGSHLSLDAPGRSGPSSWSSTSSRSCSRCVTRPGAGRHLSTLCSRSTARWRSAVRADMYGKLARHPELARAVAANQVLLAAMSDAELERAVTEPARLAGLRLEPGLVELALRDVAGEPGALPLLSHALRATWERRDGRTLTVEAYRETGGVASAIARTADSVVASVPPDRRPLTRSVFLRLTDLGEGVAENAPAREDRRAGSRGGLPRYRPGAVGAASGGTVGDARGGHGRGRPRGSDSRVADPAGLA